VVDAASPDFERRIEAVREVLAEIGQAEKPELLVFNQIDRLPAGTGEKLAARFGGVAVSALARTGLGELIERAEDVLWTGRGDGSGGQRHTALGGGR